MALGFIISWTGGDGLPRYFREWSAAGVSHWGATTDRDLATRFPSRESAQAAYDDNLDCWAAGKWRIQEMHQAELAI